MPKVFINFFQTLLSKDSDNKRLFEEFYYEKTADNDTKLMHDDIS